MPTTWRAPRRDNDRAWALIEAGRWLWDRRAVTGKAVRERRRREPVKVLSHRTTDAIRDSLAPMRVVVHGRNGRLVIVWSGQDVSAAGDRSRLERALIRAGFRTPGVHLVHVVDGPAWVETLLLSTARDYPQHQVQVSTRHRSRV